ncbi:MAG TPA: aldose epimerase family protein [Vicinamibacterales bacterium]|nr:aldose epimerase family protein [Vicinamibacterales bacterium]
MGRHPALEEIMPNPRRSLLVAVIAAGLAAGCSSEEGSSTTVQKPSSRLALTPYGKTPDGQVIEVITLNNNRGVEMSVMTYGGTILSLKTPERRGQSGDIVLGFDSLESYFDKSPYFGCLIGRYCNRIAKGRFTLDGTPYQLPINNDPNSLHGGTTGWDKVVWKADTFQNAMGQGVVLTHVSPDGDQGYPGKVTADVTYTLTDDGRLVVDYHAVTDKPTVINLTQHSYFNLSAGASADILGHQLMLNADRYTPVDETLIPTGEIAAVEGTPFDFRTPTAIGARINQDHEQLKRGKGYDHNWVLTRQGDGLMPAARVVDPASGRTLDISTTEPGIQFYSGNFLDGTLTGKSSKTYAHRSGLCLETQHYPDSPNQPTFPSTVLRPGQEYRSQTVFRFGVQK